MGQSVNLSGVDSPTDTKLRTKRGHAAGLIMALLPVGLLIGTSVTALANRLNHQTTNYPAGVRVNITAEKAGEIARETCMQVAGENVEVQETRFARAYLKSSETEIKEWDVFCNNNSKSYSISVNADTGQVFSVNLTGSTGDHASDSNISLNRKEAFAQARHYLGLLQSRPGNLHLLHYSQAEDNLAQTILSMSLSEKSPNTTAHTVVVAVNLIDGSLQSLWYSPITR